MYDVIVIGGGPAGMMASIASAKRGLLVLLIEKNEILGKKLLLTGGSRCNVTNLISVDDFIETIPVNKKVLYSALNLFSPSDIFNYFKNNGVKLKVEDNNRVFPISNSSSTILEALYNDLLKYNVKIHLKEEVIDIKKNEVITKNGVYKTKNIIIATGGSSYPQTGSTGDNIVFGKKLNQKITPIYPAEVFLITKEKYPIAGITIDNVEASIDKLKFNGSLLFTHQGLSGPVIFKISEHVYKSPNKKIAINFLPDIDFKSILESSNSKLEIKTVLRLYLQKRMADFILDYIKLDGSKKIATISKFDKERLFNALHKFEVLVSKVGDVKSAFVTGGGISFDDINSKSMESIINPGIYFVGEALDVHGHTGGFNLTIAFSTGYLAGSSVKK